MNSENDKQESQPESESVSQLPRAAVKPHLGLSWAWIIPLLAGGMLVYLVYHRLVERGPSISITFETGDGLSAHQTQVKYKSVVFGTVEDVQLSADMSHVTAKVQMTHSAEGLLTDHARFWVVRPRLEGVSAQALQSGLQTLVSGSYIALDPGRPGGTRSRNFKGLEEPPGIRSSEPGREVVLGARTLGSVGIGTPIYYRDVNVGEVLGYSLREATRPFAIRAFVRAPYDGLIGPLSQFWNVSGIRLTNDAQGFRLEMQSLRAALVGGIAFDNPSESTLPPARDGANHVNLPGEFALYESRAEAEMEMHVTVASCAAYFDTPLNGLGRGSDVTLLGQVVGAVTDVRLAHDPGHPNRGLRVRAEFVLQPERAQGSAAVQEIRSDRLALMVAKGLRAVIESKSFITGEKALSLRFLTTPAGVLAHEGDVWVLPSVTRDFDGLEAQLAAVADKVNQIPFDRIGTDLSRTLRHVDDTVSSPELQRTVKSIDAAMLDLRQLTHQARIDVAPALEKLPRIASQLQEASESVNAVLGSSGYGSNSDFQRGATRLLQQLGEAARSIRLLAETLDRHPESVLVGKPHSEDR